MLFRTALFILFACVMGFAGESVYSSKSHSTSTLYYNGFFVDFTVGASFLKYDCDDGGFLFYKYKDTYDGVGPSFGVKLGGIISELIAPHATFDVALLYGERSVRVRREHNVFGYQEDELNENLVRLFLGGGATFFPFRRPGHVMRGSYVGATLGFFVVDGSHRIPGITGDMDRHGFSWKFDLGKVWSVSERWNIGVGTAFYFDVPIVNGEEDSSEMFASLWLGAKFTRK